MALRCMVAGIGNGVENCPEPMGIGNAHVAGIWHWRISYAGQRYYSGMHSWGGVVAGVRSARGKDAFHQASQHVTARPHDKKIKTLARIASRPP